MALPKIGPKQLVYENDFQQIVRVPVDFGDFTKEYFVREDGKHVGLVVAQNRSVLLVRQYRLLIDGLSWEIPGGGVDEGEEPEQAAIRECLEETGLLCRNLKPLIRFHLGLDTVHNPSWVFYSDAFEDTGNRCGNPREVVQWHWVTLDDCIDMIFSQQICGSFSIVALLAYQALRSKAQ
jgi:8-oxo-dGTP pyrophosphatase MutT (NUDIX family)